MDDFQLNENNNQILPENNQNEEEDELNDYDILTIFLNIVPSTFYSLIISIILLFPNPDNKEEYLSKGHHIILYLQIILIIYLLYILKGLFFYFILAKKKINNVNLKIIAQIFYLIIDISYFVFTLAGNKSYKKLNLDFIINNIIKCIFIYSLIFIGCTHIFLFSINFLYLIIYFIYNMVEFLKDENSFIEKYPGLSNQFINLLNKQNADKNHTGTCSICLIDIEVGDSIIILSCSDLHFFHYDCIKKWLSNCFCCPLCKNKKLLFN